MNKYETTVATFDKLAEKYQEKYMDFDFYIDTYDAFCDLIKNERAEVLDVACGPGNITKYVLSRHPTFKIHGFDLSPKMIGLARYNNPIATFEVMDSRHVNKISKRYDAVICGFCFPYLSKEDIARFIQNLRDILKENGLIYLSTMEGNEERSGLETSSAGDQVYIHYHQFEFISYHLEKNGFKIIEVIRKDFPVENGIPTTDLIVFAQACS
jgi:2-polyprenyl-3-methyl-5-hydroxy-6-metoxy-1,4-benzoquinol methylase